MHNSWFCAGVFACYAKRRPYPVVPRAVSAYLLYVILQKTDSIFLGNLHVVSKEKKLATVGKNYGKLDREVSGLHCTGPGYTTLRCTRSAFQRFQRFL